MSRSQFDSGCPCFKNFQKTKKTMKNNLHKKETFEDKSSRRYACWVKNNRKAWMFWKKRNRKIFRKKKKEELREYADSSQRSDGHDESECD